MLLQQANNTSLCTPLTRDGYPFIYWIAEVFGDCVYTPKDQVSFWVGFSSLGFWLIAQTPQVIENFRNGDAVGLSPLFLFIWALGDSLNLIGALLTSQLPTQVIIAIYFCSMDVVLSGQWIFYAFKRRIKAMRANKQQQLEEDYQYRNRLATILVPLLSVTLLVGLVATSSSSSSLLFQTGSTGTPYSNSNQFPVQEAHGYVGRRLLQEVDPQPGDEKWPLIGWKDYTGYVIGCISAILYLASRVPQLVQNCLRGATDGLSPILFICAFLGNLTYASGVFIRSLNPKFLLGTLPWIVGSAGVLVLDLAMLSQFVLYRIKGKASHYEKIEEDGGDTNKLTTPIPHTPAPSVARKSINASNDNFVKEEDEEVQVYYRKKK